MSRALGLGLLLGLSAVFARAQDAITARAKYTLACHNSLKNHVAARNYEVWEKDGLIFARSNCKEGEKTCLRLSFTDGAKVYAVQVLSPTVTDSAGKSYQSLYNQDHNFHLSFPNGKSYCVSYRPEYGTDKLSRYEASPPASCEKYPAVAATEAQDSEALRQLDHIIYRLGDELSMAVHSSKTCKENRGCLREKPDEKLAGFTGEACPSQSLSLMSASLRDLGAYNRKYANPNTGMAGGQGAAPGDGVR